MEINETCEIFQKCSKTNEQVNMKVSAEKSSLSSWISSSHRYLRIILIHEYANSFRFRLEMMDKNSSRNGHTF